METIAWIHLNRSISPGCLEAQAMGQVGESKS